MTVSGKSLQQFKENIDSVIRLAYPGTLEYLIMLFAVHARTCMCVVMGPESMDYSKYSNRWQDLK